MAFAFNGEGGIYVTLLVESDYCILKMSKDILFNDFNLSPSLLFVVLEPEGAVGTDDGVFIILNGLKIKDLSIFEVLQAIPCNQGDPIFLFICCDEHVLYYTSIVCSKFMAVGRNSSNLLESIFRRESLCLLV